VVERTPPPEDVMVASMELAVEAVRMTVSRNVVVAVAVLV
jgi:hypothetical protein